MKSVISTAKLVINLFDKEFNDPTYGGSDQSSLSVGDYTGDAAYYAKEGAAAAKKGAKKLIPIIIVAVIALVIVGFALSWLSSQQTINFTIKELDGKTVSGARLIIKDSSGNILLNKLGSNQSLTLAPGDYSIRVTSIYHGEYSETLKIPQLDDGKKREDSYVVNLEKSIKGKITITLDEQKIFEKQTLSGTIQIDNTGDDDMTNESMGVDAATVSELKGDINFSPTTFTVSAGGATTISFSVTLNDDIDKIQENETIKFRIVGTTISDTIEIDLKPAVAMREIGLKGDVDDKFIRDDKLTAGIQKDFEIRIENDNRTLPLEDIKFTIIPSSGYEDELDWFEFANYAGTNKYEKVVASISPREKETVILKIKPAISAEIGDDFKGTVLVESLSIQERNIPISVDLKINKQNKAEVEIKGTTFSTDCYTSGAPCKAINTTGKLKVNNTGDVALTNIQLAIAEKSDSACELWIEFVSDKITKLEVGEDEVIAFKINVTEGTTEPYTACYFKAAYLDPITELTNVDESAPIQINVTVKDSP